MWLCCSLTQKGHRTLSDLLTLTLTLPPASKNTWALNYVPLSQRWLKWALFWLPLLPCRRNVALIYYLFPLILHKYRGGCGVEKRNSKYTIWVLKTVFEKEQFPYINTFWWDPWNILIWFSKNSFCIRSVLATSSAYVRNAKWNHIRCKFNAKKDALR